MEIMAKLGDEPEMEAQDTRMYPCLSCQAPSRRSVTLSGFLCVIQFYRIWPRGGWERGAGVVCFDKKKQNLLLQLSSARRSGWLGSACLPRPTTKTANNWPIIQWFSLTKGRALLGTGRPTFIGLYIACDGGWCGRRGTLPPAPSDVCKSNCMLCCLFSVYF